MRRWWILPLALMLMVEAAFAAEPAPVLIRWGIEKDNRKTVTQFYHAVVKLEDLNRGVGYFVAETDRRLRAHAATAGKSPQSIANLAGTAMEYSLLVALLERGKRPLYWQAEFQELPNNFYDVMFFTKERGPVVLSPKTSLRERYKQADLEALALRGLYPQSWFFLLSLDRDKKHIANIQRKITGGRVHGIVGLYDETNMDELFQQIEQLRVQPAPTGALRSGHELGRQPLP